MRKEGRFAYGKRVDFDINYVWVDTELEKTVSAPDISLTTKLWAKQFGYNLIDY